MSTIGLVAFGSAAFGAGVLVGVAGFRWLLGRWAVRLRQDHPAAAQALLEALSKWR
jgi:hypothetical protein